MCYYDRAGTPITRDDWMRSMGDLPARVVAKTTIGASEVSTVWLGLDHGFGDGPPLIFETLVFGGVLADEMYRYSTEEQALKGHAEMCARVRRRRIWYVALAHRLLRRGRT